MTISCHASRVLKGSARRFSWMLAVVALGLAAFGTDVFAAGDCGIHVVRVRMLTLGGREITGWVKLDEAFGRSYAIGAMVFNPIALTTDGTVILPDIAQGMLDSTLAKKVRSGERILGVHRRFVDSSRIAACDQSGAGRHINRTKAECDFDSSDRRSSTIVYVDTIHRWTAPRSISSVWGLRSCRSGGRGLERLKLSEPFRMLYARSRRIDLDTVRLVVTSDSLTWCDAYDPLNMMPDRVFERLATGKPLAHWRFVRCEDGFELDLVGFSPEWNAARLSASVDPAGIESVLTKSDHMERDCLRRHSEPLREAIRRGEVLQFVIGTP